MDKKREAVVPCLPSYVGDNVLSARTAARPLTSSSAMSQDLCTNAVRWSSASMLAVLPAANLLDANQFPVARASSRVSRPAFAYRIIHYRDRDRSHRRLSAERGGLIERMRSYDRTISRFFLKGKKADFEDSDSPERQTVSRIERPLSVARR